MGYMRKNLKKRLKKKFRFRKKKFRLWYRYRNWTLVSVPDTETWFRSYTNLSLKLNLKTLWLELRSKLWISQKMLGCANNKFWTYLMCEIYSYHRVSFSMAAFQGHWGWSVKNSEIGFQKQFLEYQILYSFNSKNVF